MALEVGSRLGHYDVTALIGEGGMGQVYQATDTELGREVALKILPDAFASDPDRLARFQREAQVLASLNHPGIAAIYGIEKSDDTQALVLELVEGPTLADRIAQRPIPVDEALPIAKQIAEALEAAHEAGVIHRDLKPANIKVREDGTVKVLDFGLAKALDTTPEGDPSQSPTITAAATATGMIIGTAAYMSPEQASGKAVDKRADIWSFGAVVFEMLTGRRAFQGDEVSETMAAIMMKEPEWPLISNDVPSHIYDVLRRCFEKDPRQRVRDIGDVRLAIAAKVYASARPSPSPTVAGLSMGRVFPALGAMVVGGLITGVAVWSITSQEPDEATRFTVSLLDGESLGIAQDSHDVAISPNGRTVAYLTGGSFLQEGADQLYVRALDRLAPVALVTDGGPLSPFFSPDGEWVGFYDFSAGPVLKRVNVQGGAQR